MLQPTGKGIQGNKSNLDYQMLKNVHYSSLLEFMRRFKINLLLYYIDTVHVI